jgi:pyruvate,orthophosphate dikinase
MKRKKYIYFFGGKKADGTGKMKDILGGKGAGLAEMTNIGAPVPPGFTVSTEVCRIFYKNKNKLPNYIKKEINQALRKIEKITKKKFGDPSNPLLLSVRSGAKFSMPGMMDTILNIGLNDATIDGLIKNTGNERFAYDSYRRLIQMFGNVVLGIEKDEFENLLNKKKESKGVKLDVELTSNDLKELIKEYKELVVKKTGKEFPQDVHTQLSLAQEAVLKSWNNPRAITYRKINNIPDDLGTAINVQVMVFGNMGEDSATGVGFTRNPSTGKKEFYGEYLPNAQGEDVVAGIRTPKPLIELKKDMPHVYEELFRITQKLEQHYKDVQDFEFTVEKGKLYMLQTRTGKRTAQAAIKIAVDMKNEKLISQKEAILRIQPEEINQLLHPIIDESVKVNVIAKGLPASPGAAVGIVVFSADDAVEKGVTSPVILVRNETNPDDIHGMEVAKGILTARGGMTSHAAVVARGMGKPCIVGCESIVIDEKEKKLSVNGISIKEGEWITIDGTTGRVILGKVPTIEPILSEEFNTFMSWVDEIRRLKVRANADIPRDAKVAMKFGAEGIGLCRTEHMFFAEDRLPIMQEMIMAKSKEERIKALDKLLPMQKNDFLGLFREMKGYPVTIRTLDPPLHEFLPKREELIAEIEKLEVSKSNTKLIEEKKKILEKVNSLYELNPMLGHRGCRLGITYPEITQMQAKAIFEAACELKKEGSKVLPEVMIPLVSDIKEFVHQKNIVIETAKEVFKKYNTKVEYTIGTMIEIPRAAILADEIAKEAEFFSFGTNDLTQTTYGISRDDAHKFIEVYKMEKIFNFDPFSTLDQNGVGKLMIIAIEKGRKTRKNLKIGICGEHGGDPESVIFCHKIGLDYVSCSPYRVPIAKLAAAHAVLGKSTYTSA